MGVETLSRLAAKASQELPQIASIPAANPESVGLSGERLGRVGEVIRRHIEAGTVTGAVTAVARRGKLAYFETHGERDLAAGTPMPADAVFRMASSTKPVTGVAVLMMMEEGRLRLSDKVREFIPEFRDFQVATRKPGTKSLPGEAPEVVYEPAGRDLTILDLMTHTSGLISGGVGAALFGNRRERGDTLATYIPKLGSAALDFQPGTKWRYSGGAGIDTLGRIVEITSGKDFATFLKTRIFEPLGMKDTSFDLTEDKLARLLPLYRRENGEWVQAAHPTKPTKAEYHSGAGGLTSTARDYLLFQQMLTNKGELGDERLLGARTVELMGTNHVGDLYRGVSGDRLGHGFGLTVHVTTDYTIGETGRSNGAFGWAGAFGTITWTDPAEQISGVTMLQQRVGVVQADIERAIRQAIID